MNVQIRALHNISIGVLKEKDNRVALIPPDVKKLVDKGAKVEIESNAGVEAGFTNKDYTDAGASISKSKQVGMACSANTPCRESTI